MVSQRSTALINGVKIATSKTLSRHSNNILSRKSKMSHDRRFNPSQTNLKIGTKLNETILRVPKSREQASKYIYSYCV